MTYRRAAARLFAAAALAAALPALAIVSERHLKGVKALECDLEAGSVAPAMAFRLIVDAKQRTLQLAGGERFPYEEASDSRLRFRLVLAHGAPLGCELELPAGALTCVPEAGSSARARLGLCMPAQ